MTQLSGYWTTGGSTGHQQVSYSQALTASATEITAGCSKFEGIANSYKNGLAGTVTGANTVSINTGGAVVDGKWYYNDAALSVNIPSAVGAGNTRIDKIVLRCNWSAFQVTIYRIAGTDAATPSAPAISSVHGSVYDIELYDALVNTSGTVTLTDKRVFAVQPETIIMHLKVFADADKIAVGNGALTWTVPEQLNGAIFNKADIACTTAGTSGQTIIMVQYGGTDVLTTAPRIDANEFSSYTGTRGVANGATISTGAKISIDIDSVSTDSAGLEAILVFTL